MKLHRPICSLALAACGVDDDPRRMAVLMVEQREDSIYALESQ
jgi:hypothetical protein